MVAKMTIKDGYGIVHQDGVWIEKKEMSSFGYSGSLVVGTPKSKILFLLKQDYPSVLTQWLEVFF